eukprot:2156757-Prymnesium_polylepis.1
MCEQLPIISNPNGTRERPPHSPCRLHTAAPRGVQVDQPNVNEEAPPGGAQTRVDERAGIALLEPVCGHAPAPWFAAPPMPPRMPPPPMPPPR